MTAAAAISTVTTLSVASDRALDVAGDEPEDRRRTRRTHTTTNPNGPDSGVTRNSSHAVAMPGQTADPARIAASVLRPRRADAAAIGSSAIRGIGERASSDLDALPGAAPAHDDRSEHVDDERHDEQREARRHQRRQAELFRFAEAERDEARDRVRRRSRGCAALIVKIGLMMIATAIVSPSARPSPSIEPPMMPPRPNGRTTARIIPQRRRAERERALLLARRRLREHLAHDRRADRDDHQRERRRRR